MEVGTEKTEEANEGSTKKLLLGRKKTFKTKAQKINKKLESRR